MTTALLVIDMQNVFAPMVQDSIGNVVKLIDAFRDRKLPVIFTQHGHTEVDLSPPYPNMLVRKWGVDGSIRVGTDSWKLIPDMQERVRDDFPIIPKNTYDAFLGGKLEDVLRDAGVKNVVVCGVMTDCCCDTTGRGAFNRGFDTCMVGDACGTASPAQHERGLAVFEYAFGDIVQTKDILERIHQ